MKNLFAIFLCVLMLTGCAARETFETVDDELLQPASVQQRKVQMTLPEDAASPVVNTDDGGKLYLCDGYTLTVQTLDGGDMDRTARQICGYGSDMLTMVKTVQGGFKRSAWAWSSAGEAGDQVGRAVVLDDGTYHYCVCVMAEEADAGALEPLWSYILSSVDLA